MTGRLTIDESERPALERALMEIIGHLGAALNQKTDKDDTVIMDHVEKAYDVALSAYRIDREEKWAARRMEILNEITTKGI